MPDIFDQLDEAPARDVFDELDAKPAGDVFDQLDSRGAAPVEPKEDPRPRLRRESFRMMQDAGRLSPRLQRDVADESSGIIGGTLRVGKNVIGAVAENLGEAVTSPFTDTEAFTLNSLFGEGTGGKVAEDLRAAADKPPAGIMDQARTKEVLGNFVKYFEGNGVTDGKEMMAILRDSIAEGNWDPTSDDKARVLSDGTLRVNPKLVALPSPDEGIAAINASSVPQEEKDREIANFTQARALTAKALDEKARSYDAGYRQYAEQKAAEGVTDPEQVFFQWPGLNRGWIEGSWDVVRDTVSQAGRDIANTIVRAPAMGLAAATGADEDVARIGKDILESQKKSSFNRELAAARGQEGAVTGTGKELGTTVLDMVPMFAGGAGGRLIAGGTEAGAARQILGKITTGTSVYGYAGAQGYASLMQTALEAADRKAAAENRELTGTEINDVVDRSQGAALANGFQTAILSKLLGEGVEKTAIQGLTAQAGNMTGREVLASLRAKFGDEGWKAAVKSDLKDFAKQAYQAGKIGFKDEALEEGVNQYLEGLITKVSGADGDKTWDEIGQETFKGAWMGGVVGGGLPVAQQTLAKADPVELEARKLAVEAQAGAPEAAAAAMESLEDTNEESIPPTEVSTEAPPDQVQEEFPAAGSPGAEDQGLPVEPLRPAENEGGILNENAPDPVTLPATGDTVPAVGPTVGEGSQGSDAPQRIGSEADAAEIPNPNAYSKENLATTFDLTPEQAEATDTLVQAMGLDTSKILLKKGGTPGKGMLGQNDRPTQDRVAAALPEANRQAAAKAMGFDSWTLEAAQDFTRRLSDWLVAGKPDGPLVESFRTVINTDKNLLQDTPAPQGYKGSFEKLAEGGKMLLRGLTNPNVSTGLHEIAHVARTTLFDRSDPQAGITAEDITVAEEWAGAKDGEWSTKAEEKFARGFEKYLRDGEAPTPELTSVFSKIADWFRNIYQKVAGSPIDIQISPEMKAVFDRLVTRGELPAESATGAGSELPETQQQKTEVSEKSEAEGTPPLTDEDGVVPSPPVEAPPAPAAELPEGVTALKHAVTDADRTKLGLPPRTSALPTTDQAAWGAAVAASAADPNAGSDLLAKLMASAPRALTKYEHALLLHEKLRRGQQLENRTANLNNLPEGTSFEERNNASKQMSESLDAFETLLTYADAAGSASGLSLQARKMLVAQDYSLAGVVSRMLGAKNKWSETRQTLTPAELKEAAEMAEKLRQAQERVDSLQSENAEQARVIEQLTKDVERAQERAGNREPKNKSKIRKALASRAEAAKSRLKDKGFLAQEDVTPSVIADAAAIAADWLVDGILKPVDFLTRAIKEFGAWVSDHIDAIRKQADQIYHETADSVSGKRAPSPEEVMDGVDPTKELDKATVWRLARAFVVSGLRGNNVLTSVHETLATKFPEITRERVAELFTDYGKVSYPSKDAATTELNKLRNLERTALKILDLKAGIAPKRTGFQRGDQDAEVRKAEKEFRALLKESGIEVTDPEQQLKTALGAAKRRMENEIEELELAVKSGQPRVKGERGVDLDPEGLDLKKRLEETRKAYATAFPAESDPLQDAKDSASASIDRYLQMLVRGDVTVPKKPGVTPDAELEDLRALRDTFAKQVQEARNPKPTEAEAREKARQAAITGAEETLAEIERRIAEGDIASRAKKESPFAADLADLRQKIKDGRAKLAEMRKAAEPKRDPEAVRIENLVKHLDRQIADEQDRIAKGDLKDAARQPAADTPEITARREKLAELRQQRRDLHESAHPGETALEQAKKAVQKSIEHYREILDGKTKPVMGNPITPDAELRAAWDVREALRDEVAEMRRALPASPAAEARQIAAALKSAEENLVRLERKILDRDLTVPPKRDTPASRDARVQAVRGRVKELNKELSRLRREAKPKLDPEVTRLKRYLGSVEKRKAELERRMRENDFSPKAKPAPLNTAETRAADYAYAKVRAEYQEKLIDHTLKHANFTKKLGHGIRSTSNLMKVLTLGGDFGVMFRNLGGATTNALTHDALKLLGKKSYKPDPFIFKNMVSEGFKAFKDATHEVAHYERIVHRPLAGYDKAFGMKYAEPFEVPRASTEDIPPASLIDKIPWWVWPAVAGVKIGLIASNPVLATAVGLSSTKIAAVLGFSLGQKELLKRLDRAQRAMTNEARSLLIDSLITSMPGDTVSVEDGKALATAVMVATGRGQAKSLDNGPLINAAQTMLLAARFYLSRIQALTLYPLWSGTMSMDARKQVAGMYGKSVTGRASIYLLLALAFGKKDDDDPEDTGVVLDWRSKDFGKVRISKDVMIDVASGLNQWGTALSRAVTGTVRNKETGKIEVFTPQEASDDITRFFAGRRNLAAGYLWDTFVKKEYYGNKPRTFATALDEATSAVILNDAYQVFEDAGPAKGAFVMGLMLAGGGANVGSYEQEKAKWAELRAIKEEERQAREDKLNQE